MRGRINILIAEDNADDLFLLKQAFKRAGVTHPLATVSDGLEALAYLKGEGTYGNRAEYPFPDVLLLDLNMPRMNGFEVLEWLRGDVHCGRLIVHVFSASARESDVQRAYDLRANSYVVKQTRLDELVAFIFALDKWHSFTSLPAPPETSGFLAETGHSAPIPSGRPHM
jgi:CheY-like chemotaxis protein